MRIGYYIPGWPPGMVPNGNVSRFGSLGTELRKIGHEVFYITPFSLSPLEDDAVVIAKRSHSLLSKVRYNLNFEAELFRNCSEGIADAINALIVRRGLDIVEMEETHGFATTVIRRCRVPVVVRL